MDDFTIVNKTVSLCARRNSGKTCLMKYLVQSEIDKFDKIFLISPTEKINGYFSDIIDEDCIFDEYSDEWVAKLIKRMTEINKNKTEKEKKNILLILDDLSSDVNFHHEKSLKILFTRGRHINISILESCQFLKQLSPIQRNNSDYILCGQQNKASVDLLVEDFLCGEDIDKAKFIKLFQKAVVNYGFMVINCNSTKSNSTNELYGVLSCDKSFIDKK